MVGGGVALYLLVLLKVQFFLCEKVGDFNLDISERVFSAQLGLPLVILSQEAMEIKPGPRSFKIPIIRTLQESLHCCH